MNLMNYKKPVSESGLTKDELISLGKVARQASQLGGQHLMKHYGCLRSIENKGRVGDLVTNADLDAEKAILNYLNNETPELSVLAEESGIISGNNNPLRWCVDPLDGTTNFAHGYPFFATSIGLTWNNHPILGAIDIPFLKETYWCIPNEGSFCNDQAISVSACSKLRDSLLVTGFAYDRHSRLDNNYSEFCWFTHRTRGVRRGGAAAVDLAFVASGRLDGYWERGLSPWDLAAGVALVEQAGGLISDYKGKPFELDSGLVLASAPGIQNQLINELNQVNPLDARSYSG